MSTELQIAISGNYETYLKERADEVAFGIYDGTKDATDLVKRRLRQQVVAAGLGKRLSLTWRSKVWPKRSDRSFAPAGMVWTKAPHIIRGFSEGDPIRSSSGGAWLAIPSEQAPLSRRRRGRRMTVEEFLDTYGENSLSSIKADGRNDVLYLVAKEGFRRSRSTKETKAARRARKLRKNSRTKAEPILMFTLAKQVRLGKRLDLQATINLAERRFPELVAAHVARRIERD
nr:DUF6441 family protein [uncultured Cohaesibacter sp.]